MKPLATTAVLALGLVLLAAPVRGADGEAAEGNAKPKPRPRIEVAFVLDTTGSMGGLIETAKRKIWSIANEIVKAEPTPEIRVGLVAYRDRGDEYVTRVFDLDPDLDRIYGALSALKADGGGDGPESVNAALRDAVGKLSWTAGDGVYRVIFLVGDAPPHMDYADDEPWEKTCEKAVRAGLVINALRCGGAADTERVWKEIARLSEGTYARIPQEGSETVATPFDERIAALGHDLAGTMVAYGEAKDRDDARRKLEAGERLAREAAPAGAGASVAADRASLLSKSGSLDGADLVGAVAEGRVRLEDVPAKELPEELRDLAPDALREIVAAKIAAREEIRKSMVALQKERASFLEKKRAEAGAAGRSAFDLEVAGMIRAQAGKKGFAFP